MYKFLEKDQVEFTKLAKFALGTMSIDEQEDVLERLEKEKINGLVWTKLKDFFINLKCLLTNMFLSF